MKVKNVSGTSNKSCKCGTWLQHWKNHSGRSMSAYCAEKACLNKPELGAHVKKDDPSDTAVYIVPLCTKHNAETDSFELMAGMVLVSATPTPTCKEGT